MCWHLLFQEVRHWRREDLFSSLKEWSLDNYRAVFKDTSIWKAFFISVAKTVIGVVTHVFFCAMVAFALSKKDLRGRKLYTVMGIITMFFSGG